MLYTDRKVYVQVCSKGHKDGRDEQHKHLLLLLMTRRLQHQDPTLDYFKPSLGP